MFAGLLSIGTLLLASGASAKPKRHIGAPVKLLPPLESWNSFQPAESPLYYFNQLIDHNDPSLGTFSQRYFFNGQYYEEGMPIFVLLLSCFFRDHAEPVLCDCLGGPMVLFTPGEQSIDRELNSLFINLMYFVKARSAFIPYLNNLSLPGLFAQQQNGTVFWLEHRHFGNSQPTGNLSEESLKYLTVQQAIDDLEYFANNVVLPMPNGHSVSPTHAPWVLFGGSYSGALATFAAVK